MKNAIVVLSLVCAAAAQAAGGGAGGSSGGSPSSASEQDPDFSAGVAAWKAKDWPTVVSRMDQVIERQPVNADAWNYRAHAYRQLGDMEHSFRDYERALSINPKHRAAREYLGEAYLQVGKLAEAQAQLKVLDKLCWLPCEEFSDLKEKIADYKRDHPKE